MSSDEVPTGEAAERWLKNPDAGALQGVEFVVTDDRFGSARTTRVFKDGWNVGDIRYEFGAYHVSLWRNAQKMLFSAGFRTEEQARSIVQEVLADFMPSVEANVKGFAEYRPPNSLF